MAFCVPKSPKGQIAESKLGRLWEGLIETFNPEAKGPVARLAGAAIAKNNFDLAHAEHVVYTQGAERHTYWLKVGEAASRRFVDAFAAGKREFSNPVEQKAARAYENWGTELAAKEQAAIKASGKDATIDTSVSSLPRLFVDEGAFIAWADKTYGRAVWTDPRRVTNTFKVYKEARDNGRLTPKFANPEDIMQTREHAANVADLRADVLADLESKGVAVRAGREVKPPPGFTGQPRVSPGGVKYWVMEEIDPLLHNAWDSQSLWNLQGSALARGASAGFRVWMNAKNKIVPLKLSLSLFHPLHVLHIDAAAGLTRATKELAGGNVGRFILEFATNVPGVSLARNIANTLEGYPLLKVFQGRKKFSSLNAVDRQAWQYMSEGGLIPSRPQEETSGDIKLFKDAVARRSLSMLPRLPFAFMAGISHPIFSTWIPSLKIASYVKDAKLAIRMNPEWTADQRQVALRSIARKVDARYGEMNYGNLFWPKVVKDTGVATTLSLGWNLGLLDQYGGGAVDLGSSLRHPKGALKEGRLDRPIMAAMYVSTAMMIGGLMTKWLSGKDPDQMIDYTHPLSGEVDEYGKPIRLNTMFYTREFEALYKRMEQQGTAAGLSDFVLSKGSGMVEMGREALSGVSSMGVEIRDPEGSLYKQIAQTVASTLAGLDPITVEALQKSTGVKMEALAVTGFGPAGQYISQSPTEAAIQNDYNTYERRNRKPFEIAKMQEDTKKLRKAYNDGDEHYDEMMDKLVKDYDLSTKDIRRLEKQMASSKESQFDPSAFMFDHLEWPQMRDRLKAMTPDEREYYLQHISKDKRQKWYREEDSESSNP